MAADPIFCFGLEFLGTCKYDPKAPSPTYFTIGDAIAALAVTFAINQFLKPLYRLRLNVIGIGFGTIVSFVFFGAALSVVAAIVPSLSFLHGTPLSYPLNWEIMGGIIIGIIFGFFAWITLKKTNITRQNIHNFSAYGISFLSEANDDERSQFARELFSHSNLTKLCTLASEIERAERHAAYVEIEDLKSKGRTGWHPLKATPSAFFIFKNRKRLDAAYSAWQILQVISDNDFCRIVVTRHSLDFLNSIVAAKTDCLDTACLKPFVQSVATQALIQDNGMLAREARFDGFGKQRTFADRFFGNAKMQEFDPFRSYGLFDEVNPSKFLLARLNLASKLMVKAELQSDRYWNGNSINSVTRIYESICRKMTFERLRNRDIDYLPNLLVGIIDIIDITNTMINSKNSESFYLLSSDGTRHDSLDYISQLIHEALISVSNNFQGPDDYAWIFVYEIIRHTFENNRDEKNLNPIQQRVLIKIIKTLKDNMDGFYPTLSRVMISYIGPYDNLRNKEPHSPINILRDAVFVELKKLPVLYNLQSEKLLERLPPHVAYDHINEALEFTYRNKTQVVTNLKTLEVQKVDPYDRVWLQLK